MACASPALVPGPAKFGALLPPPFEEDSAASASAAAAAAASASAAAAAAACCGFGLALGLGRGFLFGLQRDRRIQAAAQSVHVGVDGGDLGRDVFAESGHQHGREHRSALQALHGLLEIGGVDRGVGTPTSRPDALMSVVTVAAAAIVSFASTRASRASSEVSSPVASARVVSSGTEYDAEREALRRRCLRLSRGRRQGDACAGGGDEGECDSGRDDRGAPASAASGDSESATGRSGGRDGAHVTGSVWGFAPSGRAPCIPRGDTSPRLFLGFLDRSGALPERYM